MELAGVQWPAVWLCCVRCNYRCCCHRLCNKEDDYRECDRTLRSGPPSLWKTEWKFSFHRRRLSRRLGRAVRSLRPCTCRRFEWGRVGGDNKRGGSSCPCG